MIKRLERLEGHLPSDLPTKEQLWDMTDAALVDLIQSLGPPFYDFRSLSDAELDLVRTGDIDQAMFAKLRSLQVPHFVGSLKLLEDRNGTNAL